MAGRRAALSAFFDLSRVAISCAESQPARGLWQQCGKFPRPLDGHHAAFAEVVVEADAQGVVFTFQSVEIEVIERETSAGVFVDEGESGTRDVAIVAKAGGEAFYKLRFPRAEIAFEREHFATAERGGDAAAKLEGVAGTMRNDRSHG